MAIQFNKNEYEEDRKFEIVPIGEHQVRITEAKEGVSMSSGKNMITLVVEPVDEKIKGKLWYYIIDDKYASQKIGDVLLSCGFTKDKIPLNVTAHTFRNLIGTVKVKHETYKGEKQAKINYWIKAENPLPAETTGTSPEDIPF